MNWYVGTDWSVIPAGGNSLRQVFVRLEDYETLAARCDARGEAIEIHKARIRELEAALLAVVTEGKAYAAHHTLEHCAQAMYDIASGALAHDLMSACPPKEMGAQPGIGSTEPEPQDYRVQCRCGWMGQVSALKSLPDFKMGCPDCSAEFVPLNKMTFPVDRGVAK